MTVELFYHKNHNIPSVGDTYDYRMQQKRQGRGLHALPSFSALRLKKHLVILTISVEGPDEVE